MKSVNLRLDDDLHARLVNAAKKNRRSLQQHIIWQLETLNPPLGLDAIAKLASPRQEEGQS